MKKSLLLLFCAMFLVLGFTTTAKALVVDAILKVTADNIVSMSLNGVALTPASKTDVWTNIYTSTIQLNFLEDNALNFFVLNTGNNGPLNPAGLLAEITLLDGTFAQTGTNQVISNTADYWYITAGLPPVTSPTSWAHNDFGIYGGANPIWWNANSGNAVSGISGEAEWIWTNRNFVSGGDDMALVTVKLSPVPEPATMAMLGMGILGLFGLRKKG